MNNLEVSISLLMITFMASVQYLFLARELFRLDTSQILQSMLLSTELVVFNLFMLMGVRGVSTTVTAAVFVGYFVFIVLFSAVFLKQIPSAGPLAGVIAVLFGLFLTTDADISGFMNTNMLYLVVSNTALALGYTGIVQVFGRSKQSSRNTLEDIKHKFRKE